MIMVDDIQKMPVNGRLIKVPGYDHLTCMVDEKASLAPTELENVDAIFDKRFSGKCFSQYSRESDIDIKFCYKNESYALIGGRNISFGNFSGWMQPNHLGIIYLTNGQEKCSDISTWQLSAKFGCCPSCAKNAAYIRFINVQRDSCLVTVNIQSRYGCKMLEGSHEWHSIKCIHNSPRAT